MTASKPTEQEIIALETAYWDAMKAKDGKVSAKLSATTALVTGSNGVSSIPKSKMGSMTEDGNWTLESYQFDDIHVVVPTPEVAIIAYTVTQDVTMGGKKQKLKAADSSTWVKGANGWECHGHSETFLNPGN